MLDDPHLTARTLADVLVFSRSHPSLDELLVFFTACASTVVTADQFEVHQGRRAPAAPVAPDGRRRAHVVRCPVLCGDTEWGELRLTYDDTVPDLLEASWGTLLAQVLGAALVTAGLETAAQGDPGRETAHLAAADDSRPNPNDLVALVLHCAETLDLMADASTRARLALVVGRLADAVGASSWSVGLRHGRRLYDVAHGEGTDGSPAGLVTAAGELELDDFPARLRASTGGGFYADRSTGDLAERQALGEGDGAVIGAGGYDLDGRSWVVTVRSAVAGGLEQVTPVLFALVLAALSFPREAAVPRPVEPGICELLTGSGSGSGLGHPGDEGAEVGAAG